MSVSDNSTCKQQLLNRVRGEFLEMPELRLRIEQAQRLWGLERSMCEELLTSLVEARFLWQHADETYGLPRRDRRARGSAGQGVEGVRLI